MGFGNELEAPRPSVMLHYTKDALSPADSAEPGPDLVSFSSSFGMTGSTAGGRLLAFREEVMTRQRMGVVE